MKRDLSFKNKSYERAFTQSKLKFQSVVVNIISGMGILYRMVIFILSTQQTGEKSTPSLNLINSSIFLTAQITAVLITRYKLHLVEKVLMCLIIINLFSFLEGFRMTRDSWSNITYFHYGTHFGSYFFCLLVGRIRWLYTIMIIFATIAGYNCRYIGFEMNRSMNYFPLISSVIHFICIIIASYHLEKSDRNRFGEMMKYNLTMESFKHFIKEVLPSGVLIIRNQKILFENLALENMLKKNQRQFVLEDTKNIQIEKRNFLNGQGMSWKNKSEDIQLSYSFADCSLYEIITDHKLDMKVSLVYHEYLGSMDHEAFNEEIEKAYFDIKIGSVLWEGKPANMILISKNPMITKIKHMNNQAHYKNKLLATVSHDLRTPLNGIIGMIETSIEKEASKETRKRLQVALRSSQLLLYFVNDILDYSQIIHGSLRLTFSYFSIVSVLKDLTKLIKFQAKSKGLEFIFQDNVSNSQSDGIIKNDPNRLKQIVLNLLGNALKFTSEGFIRISVSVLSDGLNRNIGEPQRKQYFVEVEDSGCGIKKENIPKLFRVFGKLEDENSARINETGVGLGLSISQNIVKYLNGHENDMEIKVRSEVGKGSCFYFPLISHENEINIRNFTVLEESAILSIPSENDFFIKTHESQTRSNRPFMKEPLNEVSFCLSSDRQNIVDFKKLKVLVVDDDQINIMVCSAFLKTLGIHDFHTAFSGIQALDILEREAKQGVFYEIILMDCNMPLMDGYEATKIICQRIKNNEIPPVPIIACTANASPKDHEECYLAGMTEILSKPFTMEQLKTTIISERIKFRT